VSGRDFSQFMRWYTQAGTPEIVVTPHYDARAKTYRLDVVQKIPPTPGQPAKEPMVIPLAIGLLGKNGGELPLVLDGRPLERGVLTLKEPSQSFTFSGIAERPIPSLNRGFSAPVKLSFPIEPDDLRFLAAYDSDPFNCWQAVQTLAMSLLTTNVAALRKGAPVREDEGLMGALGAILADKKLEPAFIALTLKPPSEADIAREIGHDVDPDAIFAARRRLRTATGERLGAALEDAYVRLNTPAPYRPDAEGAGRRALKNICLDFLAATQDSGAIARAIPIRGRRQHDRPHGGAADAFAARPA
jgi:aminopeptidase N